MPRPKRRTDNVILIEARQVGLAGVEEDLLSIIETLRVNRNLSKEQRKRIIDTLSRFKDFSSVFATLYNCAVAERVHRTRLMANELEDFLGSADTLAAMPDDNKMKFLEYLRRREISDVEHMAIAAGFTSNSAVPESAAIAAQNFQTQIQQEEMSLRTTGPEIPSSPAAREAVIQIFSKLAQIVTEAGGNGQTKVQGKQGKRSARTKRSK